MIRETNQMQYCNTSLLVFLVGFSFGSLNFSRLFPLPRVGRGRETLPRAPLGVKGRRLKFRLQFWQPRSQGLFPGLGNEVAVLVVWSLKYQASQNLLNFWHRSCFAKVTSLIISNFRGFTFIANINIFSYGKSLGRAIESGSLFGA